MSLMKTFFDAMMTSQFLFVLMLELTMGLCVLSASLNDNSSDSSVAIDSFSASDNNNSYEVNQTSDPDELKLLYPSEFDFSPFHNFIVNHDVRCSESEENHLQKNKMKASTSTINDHLQVHSATNFPSSPTTFSSTAINVAVNSEGRVHSNQQALKLITGVDSLSSLFELNRIVRMKLGVDFVDQQKKRAIDFKNFNELQSLTKQQPQQYFQNRQRHPLDTDDDDSVADIYRHWDLATFTDRFSPLAPFYYYQLPYRDDPDPPEELDQLKHELIRDLTPEVKHYYNLMFYHFQVFYGKKYTCQERLKRFLLFISTLNFHNHRIHVDPSLSGSTPIWADMTRDEAWGPGGPFAYSCDEDKSILPPTIVVSPSSRPKRRHKRLSRRRNEKGNGLEKNT